MTDDSAYRDAFRRVMLAGDPAEHRDALDAMHAAYLELGRGAVTPGPLALPYPDPTDPVAEGADAIRDLAETMNGSIRAGWTYGTTNANGGVYLPITPPFAARPLYIGFLDAYSTEGWQITGGVYDGGTTESQAAFEVYNQVGAVVRNSGIRFYYLLIGQPT